jgi:hypothetical protein
MGDRERVMDSDQDMKIALISDIHGNLPALETMLADLEGQSIDQIVCLDDVAIFGPQPRDSHVPGDDNASPHRR